MAGGDADRILDTAGSAGSTLDGGGPVDLEHGDPTSKPARVSTSMTRVVSWDSMTRTEGSAGPELRPMLTASGSPSSPIKVSGEDAVIQGKSQQRVWHKNRHQRAAILQRFLFGICVTAVIIQESILSFGIGDCKRGDLKREECASFYLFFLTLPLTARQFFTFSFWTGMNVSLYWPVRANRRAVTVVKGSRHARSDAPPSQEQDDELVRPGHWTAVASRDIFEEVCDTVASTQIWVVFLVETAAVLVTAALARAVVAEAQYSSYISSYVVEACCPEGDTSWSEGRCSIWCRTGFHAHGPFLAFTCGTLAALGLPLCFVPRLLWSPVTSRAVEITGKAHMRRLLRLPPILMVFLVANAPLLLVHAASYQMFVVPPGHFWSAVLVADILVAVAEAAMLLWSLGWSTLAQMTRRILDQLPQLQSRNAVLPRHAARYGNIPKRRKTAPPRPWQCRESLRYRELVLLFAGSFAFSIDALATQDGSGSYELWAVRAAIILLLVFSRDEEADFKALEGDSGYGFGLLLDAKDLRAALCRHLGDRRKSCWAWPAGKRVRRYKGTLLRMSETMAVSYRWHSSEAVEIANLGLFNMTTWQLRALAEAIADSQCRYVWLDACSVPQAGHNEIKKTLLSRMMAVYASAYATVALLSRECEKNRYHQRVWTLQEFCSSSRLMVVVEEGAVEGEEAVKGPEADVAQQLRTEHLRRQPACVPVWIYGDDSKAMAEEMMPAEDAARVWETYQGMREMLNCLHPADAIRALYPLLWNRPAESQDDLVQLMKILEASLGIDQQQLIETLLVDDALGSLAPLGCSERLFDATL